MKSTIFVAKDAQQLAQVGADIWMETARDRVETRGFCRIAISGGSTPRSMHRLLARAPYASEIPWPNLHLFWVDERLVPVEDPASNYGAAKMDLLGGVDLPAANVHPMPVDPLPEIAAGSYESELAVHFGKRTSAGPVFDLVFLGVGTDGHTASIFPADPTAETNERWVVAVRGGSPEVSRLTLTYAVLNSARRIVFLVSGAAKASILKRLLADKDDSLPAGRIHPRNGEVQWLLDRKAAELLPPEVYRTKAAF